MNTRPLPPSLVTAVSGDVVDLRPRPHWFVPLTADEESS